LILSNVYRAMFHEIPQHIVVCRGRYGRYGNYGQKFMEITFFEESDLKFGIL